MFIRERSLGTYSVNTTARSGKCVRRRIVFAKLDVFWFDCDAIFCERKRRTHKRNRRKLRIVFVFADHGGVIQCGMRSLVCRNL